MRSRKSEWGSKWALNACFSDFRLPISAFDAERPKSSYAGRGRNRKFDILLNNTLLKTVELDDSHENSPFYENYGIPAEILNNMAEDKPTIKFSSQEGSSTGRIFQVRLLKTK